MAKKDKKKKDKQDSGTGDPVEAVRSAVERTLKATSEGTSGAQKHARDLVDEVAQAAGRFREAMGDLKVLDDLKKEVAGLRQRVAALEGKGASTAAPRRTATRRSTAAKSTAAKPAASRSRSTTAKKPATSRSRSTAAKKSAAKSTGTASRSRSTAAKKPASRTTRSRSTGSSGSSSSS
jgi:RNA polymerase primary sigma factor